MSPGIDSVLTACFGLSRWSVDERSNMLAMNSGPNCVRFVEILSGNIEEREKITLLGEDTTIVHAKFLTAWDMLVLAKDNASDEVSCPPSISSCPSRCQLSISLSCSLSSPRDRAVLAIVFERLSSKQWKMESTLPHRFSSSAVCSSILIGDGNCIISILDRSFCYIFASMAWSWQTEEEGQSAQHLEERKFVRKWFLVRKIAVGCLPALTRQLPPPSASPGQASPPSPTLCWCTDGSIIMSHPASGGLLLLGAGIYNANALT
eukprot:746638-Hanusia_phi.AAC.4